MPTFRYINESKSAFALGFEVAGLKFGVTIAKGMLVERR